MACSFGPAPDAKLSTAAFVNANSSLVLSCATDSTYLQMKVVFFFLVKNIYMGKDSVQQLQIEQRVGSKQMAPRIREFRMVARSRNAACNWHMSYSLTAGVISTREINIFFLLKTLRGSVTVRTYRFSVSAKGGRGSRGTDACPVRRLL